MTTDTQFDLSKFPASEPALCIPYVHGNITKERIQGVLDALDLGDIARIDLVDRQGKDGKPDHKRAFVHFTKWHDNANANQARQVLLNDAFIKLVYDDPWFWKVWASKSSGPTPKKSTGKAPFIAFN